MSKLIIKRTNRKRGTVSLTIVRKVIDTVLAQKAGARRLPAKANA